MLTQMLSTYQPFQELSPPQKAILTRLAQTFEQSTEYLFLSPDELQATTDLGTPEQWQTLLNLEPTHNFIKGQMAAISQIASRKAFQALLQSALGGNAQAAKQINELSGVLSSTDNNKVVVLTSVPRPKPKEEVTNE
jgi:hypothetical protein